MQEYGMGCNKIFKLYFSEKMMKRYQPIDYGTWILGDKAREGVNIKRLNLLTPDELRVWEEAVPYQDQRNDPGHGEIATYFAIKVLDYLSGKREIAIPATICHDTGWYGDDPEAWKELVEKHKDNLQALEGEAMRRPHQNRGILLAGRILEKAKYFDKYPIKNWLEIADAIGDHDTRKLPVTENGKILRIGDFLWRASYPCMRSYSADFDPDQVKKRIEEVCLYEPNSPLDEVGFEIAKLELANTMYFKFGEKQARKVLAKDYNSELQRIEEFYRESNK